MALWCGSLDIAADATDEAFVRALDRWPKVRAMASPVGWAVTVAMNATRCQARRRSMEATLLRRQPSPDAAAGSLPGAAGDAFDAVKHLPERLRTIVLLRYVADLSQAEIADALGLSRSAISTALTDAHRRLRTVLGDEPVTPTPEHHDA